MFTIKSRVVAAAAASLVALGVAAAAPASARPVATPTAHTTVSVHDATTAKSRFVQFRSPSHNIYCHIAASKHASESRCDVLKHSYAVPPKPDWCHFDWNGDVQLRHKAHFACVSDAATTSRHVHTLAYGSHARAGHIRCTSRVTGM